MIIIQTMKELLHDIEAKTICYNALAEQMKMKPMTFNTIAEARMQNHDTMTIKTNTFLVNSGKKQSMSERVSFDDIINIAHPGISDIEITHPLWTITYSYLDRGRTVKGVMQRGEKVFLHDGMIFTCTITSGN